VAASEVEPVVVVVVVVVVFLSFSLLATATLARPQAPQVATALENGTHGGDARARPDHDEGL
jgi:hypothetical protein